MPRAVLPFVLLAAVASVSPSHPARAEQFTSRQIGCVVGLQRCGARVAARAAASFVRCARAAGRDTLGNRTVADCVASNRALARARNKTISVAARLCGEAPPFGPSDPNRVKDAFTAVLRTAPVFTTQLDAALVHDRSERATAVCQLAVARGLAKVALARLAQFNKCVATRLKTLDDPAIDDLRACLDVDPTNRVARAIERGQKRATRACGGVSLPETFQGGCRATTVGGLFGCVAGEAQCGTCLAADGATGLGLACASLSGLVPGTICTNPLPQSVARQWNEELLSAIRLDFPRPPVHARNLFHVSVAMWDAWAAYDATADQVIHPEKVTSADPETDRAAAISFAAYRLLRQRFVNSPNMAPSYQAFDSRMAALGYDPAFTSTTGDSAAALGNRIGAAVIDAGLADGANESGNYADPSYTPVNDPMIVKQPGTIMDDPNRWQPLALDQMIGQNGIPIPGKIQVYVGSHWGQVTPFALVRPGAGLPYLDPGPPPYLNGVGDALFKQRILDVIRLSSQLTPDDGVRIDISPAAPNGYGNNPLGTNDGHGYAVNPVTGQPYTPQSVRRGDFTRVLAEFWADGPTSETPPGHWNVIANSVSDSALLEKRIGGTGPVVNALEWDVKLYLALNGAEHDAAIQCWETKRIYDYVRPISMIRHMGGLGQSSDSGGPSYDPSGLPLETGLVEVITAESSAPGERHADLAAYVGEVALLTWPGEPADPITQHSGVKWVRAKVWVPYQRNTFVTPPFAAYTSGHSTYSRAAAEVLTRFTGSSYFPGGLGEYVVPQNNFLKFEIGPAEEIHLQWAQYYDAADQAGISRLYGGIHVAGDDFEGRKSGAQLGPHAFDRAVDYFDGTAVP